jgi:arylsulfatase A-like enzyme
MPSVTRRPNIVLIHTDQQRYRTLGCTGNPYASTPVLDAFAKEACNFHRHIAANPVCMPSRATLFSGRFPNAHGVWNNGIAFPRKELTPHDAGSTTESLKAYGYDAISHVTTLPDVLAASGYRTASVGKLHLTPTMAPKSYAYPESTALWQEPTQADWHGPYCGFQHVELSLGHGERTGGHYGAWRERHFPDVAAAVQKGEHRKKLPFPEVGDLHPSVIPIEAHHSTWVAERSAAYIESAAASGQPFFLFAGFPDPHHPYTPPADLAAEFAKHDVLAAEIEGADAAAKPEGFARLMGNGPATGYAAARHLPPASIRLMRQYYDAMVHLIDLSVGRIFAAIKNAGLWNDTIIIFTSDHGDWLGDHTLRKKETVCSQQLVHVPFLMRAPGVKLPSESRAPMSNADVFPTLCELANVVVPNEVQGRSILPVLNGSAPAEVAPVICFHHHPRYHNQSVYNERYRYTWYTALDQRELYDHAEDPHELRNLAGQSNVAEIEKQLHNRLLDLLARTNHFAGGRISLW